MNEVGSLGRILRDVLWRNVAGYLFDYSAKKTASDWFTSAGWRSQHQYSNEGNWSSPKATIFVREIKCQIFRQLKIVFDTPFHWPGCSHLLFDFLESSELRVGQSDWKTVETRWKIMELNGKRGRVSYEVSFVEISRRINWISRPIEWRCKGS